jgi:hypothetical protein
MKVERAGNKGGLVLGLFDRFRKKGTSEKGTVVEPVKTVTQLEQFCGDDKMTCEALRNTMFLDPSKVGNSVKEAADNAKKAEKAKDLLRARIWYEIAGGLAIYEGDVKKVIEYFSECERISPNTKYPILKDPEKAVAKAQEYYQKYLKASPQNP